MMNFFGGSASGSRAETASNKNRTRGRGRKASRSSRRNVAVKDDDSDEEAVGLMDASDDVVSRASRNQSGSDGTDNGGGYPATAEGSASARAAVSKKKRKQRYSKGSTSSWSKRRLIAVAAAVLLTAAIAYFVNDSNGSGSGTGSLSQHQKQPNLHGKQLFTCPAPVDSQIESFEADEADEDYLAEGSQPNTDNMTQFKETFRTAEFDARERVYKDFKEHIRPFRKEFFIPYLKSGDHIYESACGIGLNLLATLEIIKEEANITNITVSGNEYIPVSALRASKILEFMTEDAGNENHVGTICHGDSSNLSFVPSNAFDLVFTGYISPLWDPLNIGIDFDANYHMMRRICDEARGFNATGDVPNTVDALQSDEHYNAYKAHKLVRVMQERQNEWFNLWVRELIRIAKPGAAIITELNAPPYCEKYNDWGGVDEDFFTTGASKYGWDIDPTSVRSKPDDHDGRYLVFMVKNK